MDNAGAPMDARDTGETRANGQIPQQSMGLERLIWWTVPAAGLRQHDERTRYVDEAKALLGGRWQGRPVAVGSPHAFVTGSKHEIVTGKSSHSPEEDPRPNTTSQ